MNRTPKKRIIVFKRAKQHTPVFLTCRRLHFNIKDLAKHYREKRAAITN